MKLIQGKLYKISSFDRDVFTAFLSPANDEGNYGGDVSYLKLNFPVIGMFISKFHIKGVRRPCNEYCFLYQEQKIYFWEFENHGLPFMFSRLDEYITI